MEKSPKNIGNLLVLLSALMFGSYGVWSRLIGPSMDSFFQGWTRALIILVLLAPIVLIRKEIVEIKPEDRKWVAVFLVFTSLTQAPLFYAFNHMDIGTASLLFFVSMFLTMNLIGAVFLKEKFTAIKSWSAVLAVIGMYLIFSFSISHFIAFAAAMAVLNGIASGGEIAFSKKLTGDYSPLYVVCLSWGIILVTNLIVSLVIKERQISLSFSMPWFWQLCYSVASLLGFWLVIAGFKYIDASIGALLGLLEIVFSIIFGIWIFNESLTVSVVVGGLLIIVAAALPSIAGLNNKNNF
ncbi:MAG: hypothetical protein JWO40_21 [Candidatus Doudnabacteria bacterium]|nr:hypothetical protein [Candidatus Doudnabacteria bacterium]